MFPPNCSSTSHSHQSACGLSSELSPHTAQCKNSSRKQRYFLRSRRTETGGEWQGLGKFGHVSLSLKPLQSLIQGQALHSTPNSQVPLECIEDDTFWSAPCFYCNHHIVIFIIAVWEEMVCRGVCWSSPWLGNNIISINGNENTLSPQSQKPKRLQTM